MIIKRSYILCTNEHFYFLLFANLILTVENINYRGNQVNLRTFIFVSLLVVSFLRMPQVYEYFSCNVFYINSWNGLYLWVKVKHVVRPIWPPICACNYPLQFFLFIINFSDMILVFKTVSERFNTTERWEKTHPAANSDEKRKVFVYISVLSSIIL